MNQSKIPAVSLRRSITRILLAAGLASAVAAPTWAEDPSDPAVRDNDPEAAMVQQWRDAMAQTQPPEEGCFHVAYPSYFWDRVECVEVEGGLPFVPAASEDGDAEVTGNTHDYVAEAKGLISQADGGIATKGVTSEKGVGVSGFGGGGILGPNEYSLQINTNANDTTSACDKHPGCKVWQQFVYAPDYIKKGKAAVFIQYWLIGWGSTACPKGYGKYGNSCYKNSSLTAAPDLPITDLGKMGLGGITNPGGNDESILTYGKEAWTMVAKDSVLHISSVWKEAEFNVVGNAGGSRADFNKGAKLTVTLLILDGSLAAPKCVLNAGTTGETNNLNLGACKANGGLPNIVFTESD